MNTSTTMSPRSPQHQVSLSQDAGLIGLVGLGHMISHFSQLLLAPLFPWLKDALHVGYAELGFLMTVFFTVS
ncbi:MAG: MFS transporter, partial [Burkholderiales bacterium]|nr:MFS transporter [Burkholderiales bacterium]